MKKLHMYSWGFSKYGQTGQCFDNQYIIIPNEICIEQNNCSNKNKDVINNDDFSTDPRAMNNHISGDVNNIIEPYLVKCGEFHSGILAKNGEVYTFGKNTYGQLGNGDMFISSFPRSVNFLKSNIKIKKIALGGEHTLALSIDNNLYSWGLNIYGQLGLDSFTNTNIPIKVIKFKSNDNKELLKNEYISDIAAGSHHSLIISNMNYMYSCGYSKYGSLGIYNSDGSFTSDCSIFTKIDNNFNNKKIKLISCGWYHSGCILENSDIAIWGICGSGDKFDFPRINILEPKQNNYKDIIQFEIGQSFFVILTIEGNVFSWGCNTFGELGNKSQRQSKYITQVVFKESVRIINISVGANFVLALDSNYKLFGWGNNKLGQLLNDDLERLLNPKELTIVSELKPTNISSGGYHSLIICENKSNRVQSNLKSVQLNRSLNLTSVNYHLNQISAIFDYQNKLKNSIIDQEIDIKNFKASIEKLKSIQKLKDPLTSEDPEIKKEILAGLEVFDEDIPVNELSYPEGNNDLGTGTFGEVKKCLWRKTIVAVKFLIKNPDLKVQNENVKSFIEELNILKKLRHPNIILYLGACISGPEYFLVTEYCSNGNLFTYLHDLHDRSIVKDSARIKWAIEIAKGVNYLHSFNPPILHRDLKSLNILLDHNNQAKIADFGWARIREEHMTKRRGTFQWMAPEVIKRGKYSEKADVYSFGIILWELYVQQKPYDGINKLDVAKKVVQDPNFRPPILDIIPNKIAKLIVSCWQNDETARPSFSQVIDYLEAYKQEK